MSPDTTPGACPRVEGAEKIREQCTDMLADESKLAASELDCVYLPESVDQLASAVRELAEAGTAFTVSGARTGIVGGAVPMDSRVVVSLTKMDKLVNIELDAATGRPVANVQAGMTLTALADDLGSYDWSSLGDEAAGAKWFYPVDPTERSAEVGGTIATNASGARSYKYGSTRANVLGVTIVLADGSVHTLKRGEVKAQGTKLAWGDAFGDRELELPSVGRPECKCAAGFLVAPDVDLVDIVTGSEGTLCIVAEARLKLEPEPTNVLGLMCFLPEGGDGLALVKALRGASELSPLSIEYFGQTALQILREEREESGDDKMPEVPASAHSAVFFEQPYENDDQLDEYVMVIDELLSAQGGSIDDTWAGQEDAEREKMRLLRHGVPEAVNNRIARRKRDVPELHKVGTDLAVGDDAFAEFAKLYTEDVPQSGLEYVVFGHAGENHLHVNLVPKSKDELEKAVELHKKMARRAVELGGSVTAEHGIGRLKRMLLEIQYGEEGVAALKTVKDFFDPNGLLNPGVLFEA